MGNNAFYFAVLLIVCIIVNACGKYEGPVETIHIVECRKDGVGMRSFGYNARAVRRKAGRTVGATYNYDTPYYSEKDSIYFEDSDRNKLVIACSLGSDTIALKKSLTYYINDSEVIVSVYLHTEPGSDGNVLYFWNRDIGVLMIKPEAWQGGKFFTGSSDKAKDLMIKSLLPMVLADYNDKSLD